MTNIDQAIAAVPLLSGLTPRQRKRLCANATEHTYRPGAHILREGDTSMALYIVLSGVARVECAAADGRQVVVGTLGKGDPFGEMGLIDDTTRSTSVIAVEETVCILLDRWDFEKRLSGDAEIAAALVRILNARVRRLMTRIAAFEHERAPRARHRRD